MSKRVSAAEPTRGLGCLAPLLLHSIMTICLSCHLLVGQPGLRELRLASLLSACLLPTAVFQRGRSISRLAETR